MFLLMSLPNQGAIPMAFSSQFLLLGADLETKAVSLIAGPASYSTMERIANQSTLTNYLLVLVKVEEMWYTEAQQKPGETDDDEDEDEDEDEADEEEEDEEAEEKPADSPAPIQEPDQPTT